MDKTLGDFIHEEIIKRGISASEFAHMVGVSAPVMNKFLNYGKTDTYGGKPVGEPSLEFLYKLSKITDVHICIIIGLVYPDVASDISSPTSKVLADRIERLPEDAQKIIDGFIVGSLFKQGNR